MSEFDYNPDSRESDILNTEERQEYDSLPGERPASAEVVSSYSEQSVSADTASYSERPTSADTAASRSEQPAPDYYRTVQGQQYNMNSNPGYMANPNYPYQQQYYYPPRYNTDPFVRIDTPPAKPKKKGNGFKKFMSAVALALVFGIVASASFYGVNRLIGHFDKSSGATSTVITNPGSNSGDAPSVNISSTVSSSYLESTSVSDIAENAMKFTVAVNCSFTSSSWFGQYTSQGSGTGIVVGKNDTELLIVTNNHVVEKAKTISVAFVNGKEISAIQKGTDSKADLAVIAVKLADIDADTLSAISYATLGDSDSVKVGEMVVALGNALGYGQSVTVGYISAKNRSVTVDNVTMSLLQTDAAINPGNSGGALLNMKGEVIGINSVKYSDESVEGMGFSIPVSNVKEIIESLMNSLSADEKGYIGVYVQDVTEDIAAYYGWPIGVYVVSFTDNSGASEAGIMVGDIITAINGATVTNSEDMISLVTSNRYGTVVTVTVQRKEDNSFKEYTYRVVLSQSSEYAAPTPTPSHRKNQ